MRDLFDQKSQAWEAHYRRDGRLKRRVNLFVSALESRLTPPARILDFGCGTGAISRALATKGYIVSGCDISLKMIKVAETTSPEVSWVALPVDVASLPFAHASFDAIVASSVLEYVDDVESTVAEFAKILKPGGILLATVPNPRHRIRKVEALLTKLLIVPGLRGVADRSHRARNYLAYLRISKNRYSLQQWAETFGRRGFEGTSAPLEATENQPLCLISSVKRSETGAR